MNIWTDGLTARETVGLAETTQQRLRRWMGEVDLSKGPSFESLREGYRNALDKPGGRADLEGERIHLIRKLCEAIEIAEGNGIPESDRYALYVERLKAEVKTHGADIPASEFEYATKRGGVRTYYPPRDEHGQPRSWGECLDRARKDEKDARALCGDLFEEIGGYLLRLRVLDRVDDDVWHRNRLNEVKLISENDPVEPQYPKDGFKHALMLMATLLLKHDGKPGDPIDELVFECDKNGEIEANSEWGRRDFSSSKSEESVCEAVARLSEGRWKNANSVYSALRRARKVQRESKPPLEMTSNVREWVEECRWFVEKQAKAGPRPDADQ